MYYLRESDSWAGPFEIGQVIAKVNSSQVNPADYLMDAATQEIFSVQEFQIRLQRGIQEQQQETLQAQLQAQQAEIQRLQSMMQAANMSAARGGAAVSAAQAWQQPQAQAHGGYPVQYVQGAAGYPVQPQIVVVQQAAKSRGVYIVLGLFFGCLGFHNFYAGKHSSGLAELLITLFLGWLILPLLLVGFFVLLEVCTVTRDGDGVPMQ